MAFLPFFVTASQKLCYCKIWDERVKQENILKDNIDPEILRNCEIFFFPGRWVIEKLSRKDRFILR
jgi:hypothetical protein